jgi:hypothetical protein
MLRRPGAVVNASGPIPILLTARARDLYWAHQSRSNEKEDSMSDVSSPAPATPTSPATATFTSVCLEHMRQTRAWVLFMAILSSIACGLMVLAGIGLSIAGASLGTSTPGGLWLIYVVAAGIYVPIIVFLFRYASSVQILVARGETADLEAALSSQRSYWKYIGILAIVAFGVAVIAIVVTLAAASRLS